MTDATPYLYFATPDAKPLLVEVEDGYVYTIDGGSARIQSQYPGTFVRLYALTPELLELVGDELARAEWRQRGATMVSEEE